MITMSSFKEVMVFLAITVIPGMINGVEINLKVPKVFKVHSPMWINCTVEYIKENEAISQIKWYKSDQHFYTWDHEKKEGVFIVIPGIGVDKFDLEKSTGNAIFLKSTDLNSTGCYECEVILENGVSKKQSGKTQAVYTPIYRPQPMIYVPRYDGLLIELHIKNMGDYMQVKCTSKPSVPDAEISLLINGKERNIIFDEEKVTKKGYKVYSEDYKRYNLVNYFEVNYKFVITPDLVEKNFMNVACLSMVRAPHGMLERLESENKRIRVIASYTRIFFLAHIDHKAYWLYGFIGIVVSLLGLWYIIDGNYDRERVDKKEIDKEMEDDNVSNVSSYDYAIKIRRESVAAGTFDTLAEDALKMMTGGPMPKTLSDKMPRKKSTKNENSIQEETDSGLTMTVVPLNDTPGRGERIV